MFGSFNAELQEPYAMRSALIQAICPAPKRYLQQLIIRFGLKSGLDVGCGVGSPLTSLRRTAGFRSCAVDADQAAIDFSRARNFHDDYVHGSFLDVAFPKRFDVVVMSHVIEHFNRDNGMKALRKAEKLANHLVYVETPFGFWEQIDSGGSPWQRHLSGWFPHDFQSRGYSVFGAGLRIFGRLSHSNNSGAREVVRQIDRGTQWIVFRRPHIARTIAAIRYVDAGGNTRAV
jgi:SAM-dependent methyltransferase